VKTITIPQSEYNKLLNDSVVAEKLAINVKELIIKNEELTIKNNELLKQQKVLEEKILDLQRKLFDKKKDQVQKKQAQRTGKTSKNSNKKKRGRKPIDFSNIELTKYYDFATTPVCPCCTNTMEKMGSNDSYHEDYKVVIKKIKICKAKYICRDCDVITVANGCILPIRKGLPMPGFLAQVILDKFSNGMPLYRQAQNYGYSSYNYTRQMFNNWVMQAAALLMPLLQLILKKM
jgi:transposase